jgi:hypothetical protein
MVYMEFHMKSNTLNLFVFFFSLGVLLVPILSGLFLCLRIEIGLTQARQTFYRLLKIGSFLFLSWFVVVLIGIMLHVLLI